MAQDDAPITDAEAGDVVAFFGRALKAMTDAQLTGGDARDALTIATLESERECEEHPCRHGLRLVLLLGEGESGDSLLDSFRRSGDDITIVDVLFPAAGLPATPTELLETHGGFRTWVRGILDEIAAEQEEADG